MRLLCYIYNVSDRIRKASVIDVKRLFRLNLTLKLTLGLIVITTALCAGSVYTGYTIFRSTLAREYNDRALSIAFMAASLVDGDAIPRYLETGRRDAAYDASAASLTKLIDAMKVRYIYIFYPNKKGYQYVFDAVPSKADPDKYTRLGQIEPYVSTVKNMMRVFNTGRVAERSYFTHSLTYGYIMTVFAPVFNSSGKVVALAGVDISMNDVLERLNGFAVRLAFFLTLFISCAALFVFFFLKYKLIRAIRAIADGAEHFIRRGGGDLKYSPVSVTTGDELEQLADSFNTLQRDAIEYVEESNRAAAERQRVASDMAMATAIQREALPSPPVQIPFCSQFDVYATMTPAKEVGGDFYDFFRVGPTRSCFIIADVSGKGVPAALFMMISKALLRTHIAGGRPIGEAFSVVNDQLAENNDNSMFVTAFGAVYDSERHELTCVSAGHNPPLLRRAGGCFEWVDMRAQMPLAGMEGVGYREAVFPFNEGDTLFLYTDGVTEALDAKGALYGDDRLIGLLNGMDDAQSAPLSEMLERVSADIRLFAEGAEQADDITMLIMRTEPERQ